MGLSIGSLTLYTLQIVYFNFKILFNKWDTIRQLVNWYVNKAQWVSDAPDVATQQHHERKRTIHVRTKQDHVEIMHFGTKQEVTTIVFWIGTK